MQTTNDQVYTQRCLELAEIALAGGNPPVGAIIVYDQQIIGEGIESGKSTDDISNHAEILAIRDALKRDQVGHLSKAQIYTTHEPCIMCSYMIRYHHLAEIIYGISVEYIGGHTAIFDVPGTNHVPKWGAPLIRGGICQEQCQEITRRFMQNSSVCIPIKMCVRAKIVI